MYRNTIAAKQPPEPIQLVEESLERYLLVTYIVSFSKNLNIEIQ